MRRRRVSTAELRRLEESRAVLPDDGDVHDGARERLLAKLEAMNQAMGERAVAPPASTQESVADCERRLERAKVELAETRERLEARAFGRLPFPTFSTTTENRDAVLRGDVDRVVSASCRLKLANYLLDFERSQLDAGR